MKSPILSSYCAYFNTYFKVLLLLICAGSAHGAEVYAYVDTEGKLLISEKKEDERFVRFDPQRRIVPKITTRNATWAPKWANKRAMQYEPAALYIPIHTKAAHYSPLINDIAQETGVNANLLHAMIQVESAYNPSATSSKGAQGLMQLIPSTAERFGVTQSYDPEANVRGGARYIKNLLARFDNNLQLALAAYNAGEGTVQKYNNTIPPYPETQAYVSRVLSLFIKREE